jgi:SAM-dependent methyltransferase
MRECSKSIARRLTQPAFITRYFRGAGVDIGGFPDPLALYAELFPLLRSVRIWDLPDGDAQIMEGVADDTFDFVHSSHCLEHLRDPREGLANWLRVVKPGGHLIVTVPDEDLYEQGIFPSTFNRDHKWTFTLYKERSWSERSINVLDLLRGLGAAADIERVELLNSTYRFQLPRYDQTLTPVAESGIEFVVRKRSPQEIQSGRLARPEMATSPAMNKYYNQYTADMRAMKQANAGAPPFSDETPLTDAPAPKGSR